MINSLLPVLEGHSVYDLPLVLPSPVGFPVPTSEAVAPAGTCRFCGTPLHVTFVDLGPSPLCQEHVRPEDFDRAEAFYDLHAYVCRACQLVQVKDLITPADVFPSDYAYLSSYSPSWLRHAQRYTAMAIERFGLGAEHLVVEVASNDGYLLQYFLEAGIPVLGIEPAENAANYARQKGINTLGKFFGTETAREVAASCGRADLLTGVVDDLTDVIVGLHMIGPDAPEILQAAAIAVKAKLTKADFDATFALHPTMAEELVLMK